ERDGREAAPTLDAERKWQHELQAASELARAKARLTELYARYAAPGEGADTAQASAVLAERRAVFDRLGEELRALAGGSAPRRRAPVEVNNAVLLALLTYTTDLDRFEAVWQASDHDLRATIERIEQATRGAEDPFGALAGL